MKKKLIFEVEEGDTLCHNCPFHTSDEIEGICGDTKEIFNCTRYNLETLKFIGEVSNEKDNKI